MTSIKHPKKAILLPLLILLIVGLVQSAFTNIGLDEAYYWNFAQHLDWGYFDHPPLVALMVWLGGLIFPETLGVRFVTVLMTVAMYYLIWEMIPVRFRIQKRAPWVFLFLIFINPIFSIYGFFTTPDVPLLLFTTCYLFAFRNFIKRSSLINAVILGVFMAGLIYAKYHGILVIFFSVLARLKLLGNARFYLAGLTGVLLYIPHLYWQYTHDFVSFEYHLFYRATSFELKNVGEYFLNIILVLNPFLWALFIPGYFRKRKRDILPPVMHVMFWGFILFFAFTSFRGHVEPHWVAVAAIPMTIVLHQVVVENEKYLLWFKWLSGISVVLMITARLVIALPFDLNTQFHKEDAAFYREIDELSGGKNVVFTNSYTGASKFSFYTGRPAFSYNFITYRKSQFDLWAEMHEVYWNEPAMFLTFYDLGGYEVMDQGINGWISYKFIDKFPLVNNVKVEIVEYPLSVPTGELFDLRLTATNPYDHDIILEGGIHGYKWNLFFFDLTKERVGMSYLVLSERIEKLPANSTIEFTGKAKALNPPGTYTIGVGFHPEEVFAISVSKRTYPLRIEDL